MMTIRAIYKNGQLQPLTPLHLEEGQEVEIKIGWQLPNETQDWSLPAVSQSELSPEELLAQLRASGLLLDPDEIELPEDAEELSAMERARIGALLAISNRPVEADIDEDRGKY